MKHHRLLKLVYAGFAVSLIMVEAFQPLAFAQTDATPSALPAPQSVTSASDSGQLLPQPSDLSGAADLTNLSQQLLSPDSTANPSARVRQPARLRRLLRHTFEAQEAISMTVENAAKADVKAEVLDSTGKKANIPIEKLEDGQTTQLVLTPPAHFRPGKYTLKVTTDDGNVSTQDFSWGVLALNTNKATYMPGETAAISMAVLDDTGAMVCDADVQLQITDPSGQTTTLSTKDESITVNPECQSHAFTLKPDYQASFQTQGEGVYQMRVMATTNNGSNTITDSFTVARSVPFDVERVSATRIYPPHDYPVTLRVTANQDFAGVITDLVPDTFSVFPSASPSAVSYDTIQSIAAAGAPYQNVLAASTQLGMPFVGSYPVTEGFGEDLTDPLLKPLYAKYGLAGHDGIDFSMPEGTPVLATDDGEVVLAEEKGDYGTTIVLKHSWGQSYYGHLSKIEVSVGQTVKRGTEIGLSGSTGISTGPHLHFGIKPSVNDTLNGYYGKVDPSPYLGLGGGETVLAAATRRQTGNVKQLSWHVSLKKGDTITLGYQFKAPDISPQFYTLGPLTFTDSNNQRVYQERRQWQIASDALISFVKDTEKDVTTAATSDTMTVTSTTGNTLVLLVSIAAGATASLAGVSDSAGNTWVVPATPSQNPPANFFSGSNTYFAMAYAVNATAVSSVTV